MPRTYCSNCNRPSTNCLCPYITKQITSFPIVICRHPDESTHPFTTSRIADLGATSVQCSIGLDIDEQSIKGLFQYQRASSVALLYTNHSYGQHESFVIDFEQPPKPLADAFTKFTETVDGLIVLDGTWRNTREIMLRNAWLTELPTLTLTGLPKSLYSIRKTSKESVVSTLEAVACVLAFTDSDFNVNTFQAPLRALVELQKNYQSN